MGNINLVSDDTPEAEPPQYERRGLGGGRYTAMSIATEKITTVDGHPINLNDYRLEFASVRKFIVFVDTMGILWIMPNWGAALRYELLRSGYTEDCRIADFTPEPSMAKKLGAFLESSEEAEEIYHLLIEEFDSADPFDMDKQAAKFLEQADKLAQDLRIKSGYLLSYEKSQRFAWIQLLPLFEMERIKQGEDVGAES